jgi:proline iminopeptidase
VANKDQNGLYTYYDYAAHRLEWFFLDARHDPAQPAGPTNVSTHHRIRYAVAGGKAGLAAIANGSKRPWLYVHGGPGGGFSPDDHRMVDPEIHVPIMVVQRGSAGSGNEGNMQDVSVAHFIADYVDVLAAHNVPKAHWAGGSWGTTLVLKLLLEHPEVFVKLPTLRGLWIPSTKDLQFGYSRLNTAFPNAVKEQDDFFGFISQQEAFFRQHGLWDQTRLNAMDDLPFAAYHFMINGRHGNQALRDEAARRMWRWELISAKANPTEKDLQHIAASVADLKQARGFAATICHFHANRFFLDIGEDFENCEIWQRRGELKSMGLAMGDLVHGANDSLCRPEIAGRWATETGYRLHLIPGAGHSRSEPGIRDMLIRVDNGI